MVDQPQDDTTHHLPVATPSHPAAQAQAGLPLAREFAAEADSSAEWRRYLDAVVRRKWFVGAVTLLGVAGGLGAARLTSPEFETEATIWIETQQERNAGPIQQERLLEDFAWIDLLKSFEVLDQAVRTLRLYARYPAQDSALFVSFGLKQQFAPGAYALRVTSAGDSLILTTDEALIDRVALGDSLGRSVGFAWVPDPASLTPGKSVEFSVTSPRDVARGLAVRLNTSMARQGNFLRVRLAGRDPQRITATLNAVLDHFVEVAAELKRRELTEQARFLVEQLADAERHLREAERVLRDYQVETITLPAQRAVSPSTSASRDARAQREWELTQVDPVYGNFFRMQLELDALGRDREAIVRGLAQVADAGVAVEAFEGVGAVLASTEFMQALTELTTKRAELRALRYRYTDDYGPVRRLLDQIRDIEERTVPGLARALVAELSARERALESVIDTASTELRQIPPRRIQQFRLARDVEIAEVLYTNLQQRYEEARLAELSSIPDMRVLDEALVPSSPSSHHSRNLPLLGLLGGMGLGMVGAVMLDRVDRRVRYPQHVTDQMGLPILGIIPHVSGLQNGRRSGGSAPVVEALRGIRLNFIHAYGSAGPIVVTVTSPGAGDGKSFVASNLALAFSDAGHRTLLIDGDSRRGSLHRVFAAARKPGLMDCLAGTAQVGAAIQKTEYPLLHLLGGGTRMSGAPELLGSPQMVQLLTTIRSSYAVIIIDSPPLGAGVDAFTLGTVSGNMIIVLKTGATDRDESEAKLDLLDRLPVRVLGAVLNGVKDQKAYGYKYYSYYMPGYEYEVEEEDRLLKGAE